MTTNNLDLGDIPAGELVQLVAKPDSGFKFDPGSWSFTGITAADVTFSGVNGEAISFVMPAGDVHVSFETVGDPQQVSFNNLGGSTTAFGFTYDLDGTQYSGSPGDMLSLPAGKTITLVIEPQAGYEFVDGSFTANVVFTAVSNAITFSVPSYPLIIDFEVRPITYQINYGFAAGSDSASGNIVAQSSAGTGEEVNVSINVNPGFGFTNWSSPDGSLTISGADASSKSFKFYMPSQDVSIEAITEKTGRTVSASVSNVSFTGLGDYEPGESVVIQATGEPGYDIVADSWTAKGLSIDNSNMSGSVLTFVMPSTNVELSVSTEISGPLFSMRIQLADDDNRRTINDGVISRKVQEDSFVVQKFHHADNCFFTDIDETKSTVSGFNELPSIAKIVPTQNRDQEPDGEFIILDNGDMYAKGEIPYLTLDADEFELFESSVKDFAFCGESYYLVTQAGALKSIGDNSSGQLGTGDKVAKNIWHTAIASGVSSVHVAKNSKNKDTGEYHVLALMDNGSIQGWGNNNHGQLGTGNTDEILTPTTIYTPSSGEEAVSVTVGWNRSFFIKADGTAWAMGDGTMGQLGTGLAEPAPVVTPKEIDITTWDLSKLKSTDAKIDQIKVSRNSTFFLLHLNTNLRIARTEDTFYHYEDPEEIYEDHDPSKKYLFSLYGAGEHTHTDGSIINDRALITKFPMVEVGGINQPWVLSPTLLSSEVLFFDVNDQNGYGVQTGGNGAIYPEFSFARSGRDIHYGYHFSFGWPTQYGKLVTSRTKKLLSPSSSNEHIAVFAGTKNIFSYGRDQMPYSFHMVGSELKKSEKIELPIEGYFKHPKTKNLTDSGWVFSSYRYNSENRVVVRAGTDDIHIHVNAAVQNKTFFNNPIHYRSFDYRASPINYALISDKYIYPIAQNLSSSKIEFTASSALLSNVQHDVFEINGSGSVDITANSIAGTNIHALSSSSEGSFTESSEVKKIHIFDDANFLRKGRDPTFNLLQWYDPPHTTGFDQKPDTKSVISPSEDVKNSSGSTIGKSIPGPSKSYFKNMSNRYKRSYYPPAVHGFLDCSISTDGKVLALLHSDLTSSIAGLKRFNSLERYALFIEIFEKKGSVWEQQKVTVRTNRINIGDFKKVDHYADRIGYVELSKDGSTFVFGWQKSNIEPGAYEPNHSYVFRKDSATGNWSQIGKLKYGNYAAINGDGSTIVSGYRHPQDTSYTTDSILNGFGSIPDLIVYKYDAASSQYVINSVIEDPSPSTNSGFPTLFGHRIKLDSSGDILAISSPGELNTGGSVRIYEFDGTNSWTQKGSTITGDDLIFTDANASDFDSSANLSACPSPVSDMFGYDIDLSDDGNSIVVGAPQINLKHPVGIVDDKLYSLIARKGRALYTGGFDDIGQYKHSLRNQDPQLIHNYIYSNKPGYVKIYQYSGDWNVIGDKIQGQEPNDRFGHSVSINNIGDLVTIGAPIGGRQYLEEEYKFTDDVLSDPSLWDSKFIPLVPGETRSFRNVGGWELCSVPVTTSDASHYNPFVANGGCGYSVEMSKGINPSNNPTNPEDYHLMVSSVPIYYEFLEPDLESGKSNYLNKTVNFSDIHSDPYELRILTGDLPYSMLYVFEFGRPAEFTSQVIQFTEDMHSNEGINTGISPVALDRDENLTGGTVLVSANQDKYVSKGAQYPFWMHDVGIGYNTGKISNQMVIQASTDTSVDNPSDRLFTDAWGYCEHPRSIFGGINPQHAIALKEKSCKLYGTNSAHNPLSLKMAFAGSERFFFCDTHAFYEDKYYARTATVNINGVNSDTIVWNSTFDDKLNLDTEYDLGATCGQGEIYYFPDRLTGFDVTAKSLFYQSNFENFIGTEGGITVIDNKIQTNTPIALRIYAASSGDATFAPSSNNFELYKDLYFGGDDPDFLFRILGITVNGIDPIDSISFQNEVGETIDFSTVAYQIGDDVTISAVFDTSKYQFKNWGIGYRTPISRIDQSAATLTFKVGRPGPYFTKIGYTSYGFTLNLEKM